MTFKPLLKIYAVHSAYCDSRSCKSCYECMAFTCRDSKIPGSNRPYHDRRHCGRQRYERQPRYHSRNLPCFYCHSNFELISVITRTPKKLHTAAITIAFPTSIHLVENTCCYRIGSICPPIYKNNSKCKQQLISKVPVPHSSAE